MIGVIEEILGHYTGYLDAGGTETPEDIRSAEILSQVGVTLKAPLSLPGLTRQSRNILVMSNRWETSSVVLQ